jgi:hypothetical protein
MSREKLRIANTQLDNLIGNLRGEVGEVITAWVIMRQFIAQRARLASGDPSKDIENRQLAFLNLLMDKLRDELIGRLSELAEQKISQLTFYFASRKLSAFEQEVAAFEKYVIRSKIREKRNQNVSHKALPEKWWTMGSYRYHTGCWSRPLQ